MGAMNRLKRNRRFGRIRDIGCLACRKRGWFNLPDVHHLNLGGHAGQLRLGDESTVGLCIWHHRGKPLAPLNESQCRRILGPSLQAEPIAFRETFGCDQQLLAWQNDLIADTERAVIGRAA
jgi:hypothetical protein